MRRRIAVYEMRRRIAVSLIAVFFVSIVFFQACGKKEEDNVIKIGAILPLTGSGALWGQNARKGIELALEQANRNNNINNKIFEVIFEDSKTLASQAVTAFRKLIDIHKIQCAVVDMISSNVLAISPIAEREKVVIISPGASSPDITDAGEYTFRNWPSDALQGKVLAKFVATKKEIKRVAILFIENDFGESLTDVFTSTFEELGGSVIIAESFKQGATDFKNQITKVKSKNPEALILFVYPEEAPRLIKQIKSASINIPLFATAEIEDPSILKEPAVNGIIYTFPKPANKEAPEVKNFIISYKAKYNENPGIVADVAYDAINILIEAIRKVGNDGPRIQKYLLSIKNYKGASGVITFDDNGDLIKPFVIKMIKNGKFILLEEEFIE